MTTKKRLLSVAFALFAALLVFEPVRALAVTTITDDNLKDGVYTIGSSGDYVLGGDLHGGISITASAGSVNLDLGGHSVTPTVDQNVGCITVTYSATTTISHGALVQQNASQAALRVDRNAYVTLEDVNATSTDHLCIDIQSGSVTVNSGTYKVVNAAGSDSAVMRCANNQGASATINGGTFTNEGGSAIVTDTPSNVTISGGTFSTLPEAAIDSSSLVLSTDGTYKVGKTSEILAEANYRAVISTTPYTVYFANQADAEAFAAAHSGTVEPAKVTVTFDTDGGSAVADQLVPYGSSATAPKTPTKDHYALNYWSLASDGSKFDFSQSLTSDVALKAVWRNASAAAQITDESGNTTTYYSLQNALDAVEDGQTIALIDDLTESVTASSGTFTLDLNGHTLSDDGSDTDAALVVTGTAKVTLLSSQEGGAVKQVSTGDPVHAIHVSGGASLTIEKGVTVYAEHYAALSVEQNGTLTVDGGTFTAKSFDVLDLYGGTVEINDGEFNCPDDGYSVISTDQAEKAMRLTIKGGTFKGSGNDSCVVLKHAGGTSFDVEIEGGTFYGDIDWTEDKLDYLDVSGGTFSWKASAVLSSSLDDDDLGLLLGGDGDNKMVQVIDLKNAMDGACKAVHFTYDEEDCVVYCQTAELAQALADSLASNTEVSNISTKDVYHVTFDSKGRVVKMVSVEEGSTIGDSLPAGKTIQGYTFLGWYKDGAYADANKVTAETAPASGLTAKAFWKADGSDEATDDPVEKPIASIGDTIFYALQDAIDDVEDDQTIVLLNDDEESVKATKGTFTLDLAGYTLSYGGNDPVLEIDKEANVTLTSSKDGGAVKATSTDNYFNAAVAMGRTSSYGASTNMSLTVEDGVSVSAAYSYTLVAQGGTLAINGGTFGDSSADGSSKTNQHGVAYYMADENSSAVITGGDFYCDVMFYTRSDEGVAVSGGTFSPYSAPAVEAYLADGKAILVNKQNRYKVVDAADAKAGASNVIRFDASYSEDGCVFYFEDADTADALYTELSEDTSVSNLVNHKIYHATFVSRDAKVKTVDLEEGETFGDELPAGPRVGGYDFVGWYVDGTYADANKVTSESTLTSDATIKAVWTDKSTDEATTDPDEKYVATIGDTKYGYLQDAIDAVQDGQTIKLLGDVEESVKATKGTFTLDLAGHTLSYSGSDAVITIDEKANVTLITSEDGGAVKATNKTSVMNAAVGMGDSAKDASLTVEDGVALWAAYTPYTIYAYNGGTITINGGTFGDASQESAGSITYGMAYYDDGTSKLTINGGDFYFGFSIVADDGNATISGGTFSMYMARYLSNYLADGKTMLCNGRNRFEVVDANEAKANASNVVRLSDGSAYYFENASDAESFCKEYRGSSPVNHKIYHVTFETNGTTVATVHLEEDEAFGTQLPDAGTIKGWSFVGWYVDGTYDEANEVTADSKPSGDSSDITVKSLWLEEKVDPEPDPEPTPEPTPTPDPEPTPTPAPSGEAADETDESGSKVVPETGDAASLAAGLAALGTTLAAAGALRRRNR